MRVVKRDTWGVCLAIVALFIAPQVNAADGGATMFVNDAEQLYATVNDAANAGVTVVLAPGTYSLSAKTPDGAARPNGGRLELQQDMSLSGMSGDRTAVVIDASRLPAASLNVAGIGKSGPIRLGRGSQSIEWMTLRGNVAAAGAIVCDLAGGTSTAVRVAHVVAGFGSRAVDLRNLTTAMSNRTIDAEIVDNEFVGDASSATATVPEGLRAVNLTGADGAAIHVRSSGNYVHDFQIGCIAANNKANGASVSVASRGDRFENNGLGALVIGGIGGAQMVEGSTTTFIARGSSFSDNTKPVAGVVGAPLDVGGIVVLGADTTVANSAFSNTATVGLWGTRVANNQNADFEAFGARSAAAGIAGTDNRVTIELHGESSEIELEMTESIPFDESGSNTVMVVAPRQRTPPIR